MEINWWGQRQLSRAFGSFAAQSRATVRPDTQALTLAMFTEINRPESGIIVKQVSDWYSPADITAIQDSYPQPEGERRGKIVVFSSEPVQEEWYFAMNPRYREFYQSNDGLRRICERMRNEILECLPADERGYWERHEWGVAVQWSNGNEPLVYDHYFHVHRNLIVASLTMKGSGTIAKITQQDISKLNDQQIYDEAGAMGGCTYQAAAGELMIINGVHYRGGGLHAAPCKNGLFPNRLTILVSIGR